MRSSDGGDGGGGVGIGVVARMPTRMLRCCLLWVRATCTLRLGAIKQLLDGYVLLYQVPSPIYRWWWLWWWRGGEKRKKQARSIDRRRPLSDVSRPELRVAELLRVVGRLEILDEHRETLHERIPLQLRATSNFFFSRADRVRAGHNPFKT